MTKRIVDYPIAAWPVGTRVHACEDARVLSAGYKNGVPVIFVEEPTAVDGKRVISILAWYVIDNEEFKPTTSARYVGTVIGSVDEGGDLHLRPLHVFAEIAVADEGSFLHDVEVQGALS